MGRDTGIADRLRKAGLRVVETSGWTTRGSTDFNPRGSVNHHTAGPATGATPSLNTCINGRPGLSGPLCNVMQSREANPADDIAYIVAAGRANHAGEGGWKGLSGNSSVYGLEIEHTGTSLLSTTRQQVAAAIHAAMFGGDVSMVCQHFEWAPTRKIDAATGVTGDGFRSLVAAARTGDQDMPLNDDDKVIIRNIIRQELYGDDNADDKGLTPIIRNEVKAIWESMLTTSGSTTRTELRSLSKLGSEDAAGKIAEAVVAKLPPSSGGPGLTEEDVKKVVREVFAEVRYTVAPADVQP